MVNLAHRLCNKASAGEVLIDRKVRAALDDDAKVDTLTPLNLKGYAHPVPAFRSAGRRRRGLDGAAEYGHSVGIDWAG